MRQDTLLKSIVSNILVIGIAATASFVIFRQAPPVPEHIPAPEKIAAPARAMLPDAVFYDVDGKPVKASDFRGQVLLINLWATWCPPCVVELPALDLLQAKLKDRNFRVIAVSMDRDDVSKVTAFLQERKIENLAVYQDRENDIRKKWSYDGIPASFLIDRDGHIIEVFAGPRKWDSGPVFDRISKVVE